MLIMLANSVMLPFHACDTSRPLATYSRLLVNSVHGTTFHEWHRDHMPCPL